MKTISSLTYLTLACLIFFVSCQKEFSVDQGTTTNASINFVTDASGNCSSITLNGIFKAGTLLTSNNYLDVSVNVTATGTYSVTSDTLNGVYFSTNGQFTSTGNQTVRLTARGTPIVAGTFAFIVHYASLSSCAVNIVVSPAGTTTATFTLNGAPGSCTTPTIQGTYTAGTILDPSNKIIVGVNVTSLGDYTLSTTVVNGISFSATGTFATLGAQNVTLSGTGTPTTAGTNSMTITGTATSCSFPLTVNGTTSGGATAYLAYYCKLDTTLAHPFDTVTRVRYTYDGLNRLTTLSQLDTKANGDSDYYSIETYFYTGSDTVANSSIQRNRFFYPSSPYWRSDTTYYRNFVNGVCTYDSARANNGYEVRNYVLLGNIVKANAVYAPTGVPSYLSNTTTYLTLAGGNIVHELDTTAIRPASGVPTYQYQRVDNTVTYLPNPNPFYNIGKPRLSPYFYDDASNASWATPKNLIDQATTNFSNWPNPISSFTNQTINSYVFRPDGYPVEAREAWYQNSVLQQKTKLVFIYK